MSRPTCKAVDTQISTYLYFLHPHLSILASPNKWLQSSDISLHTVYCKIQALLKTFLSPVALDSSKSISDDDNLCPIEEALLLCPGSDFQKHLADCSDHALMSERELSDAKKIMFNYVITVGKALENRFPDTNFIMENTAFVKPPLRKFQEPDLLALSTKFQTDYTPFQFNHDVLTCQMRTLPEWLYYRFPIPVSWEWLDKNFGVSYIKE